MCIVPFSAGTWRAIRRRGGLSVLHPMARRSFNPMVRRPVVCSNPMVRVVPLARVSRRSLNPMAHAIVQHAGQRD